MRGKRRLAQVVAVLILVIVMAGCAAGPNPQLDTAPPEEEAPRGFLYGLWHGFITPVTFVISLFTDDVSIYESHNTGGWYDFGFVLGLMVIFGGGSGGATHAGHRRRR